MMTYQKHIGKFGEEAAAEYLIDKGYLVLEKNFSVRYGEIDLVALDGDSLVFVEVKTRTSDRFGLPEDSITAEKMARMQNAALLWLEAHTEAPDDYRMDVISILLNRQNDVLDLQHFINADL
jgi:putative endonuclease